MKNQKNNNQERQRDADGRFESTEKASKGGMQPHQKRGQDFNEKQHPRDADGRFEKKN